MYKRSSLSLMVVCTWISAFVFLLPTLLELWGKFGLDLEIGSCSILPVNGQSPKVSETAVVVRALPRPLCYCSSDGGNHRCRAPIARSSCSSWRSPFRAV